MTESGRRIVDALADDQQLTLDDLCRATGRCGRVTKAALRGCVVAGLVEPVGDGRFARVIEGAQEDG